MTPCRTIVKTLVNKHQALDCFDLLDRRQLSYSALSLKAVFCKSGCARSSRLLNPISRLLSLLGRNCPTLIIIGITVRGEASLEHGGIFITRARALAIEVGRTTNGLRSLLVAVQLFQWGD